MNGKKRGIRWIIQLLSTVFFNGYFAGFAKGNIYKGSLKNICVPVLNCYSCPGALGSCPIGSLQAVIGSRNFNISFYVLGTIALFGVLLGRIVCGFLCPFGFIQELLYKIPLPKIKVNKKVDKIFRWFKYFQLITFVILLPIFITNKFGVSEPYFCKWICPVGILEGGIGLVLTNESLKKAIGFLFWWKFGILMLVLVSSIFIERSFCKYMCPLGAFYGLFNKFSLYRLNYSKEKCINCKACEKVCPMNIDVTINCNSVECIRCGKCKNICPTEALNGEFLGKNTRKKR